MWVTSELRLPGHPGPTAGSQDTRNDDPPRDSTATSIPSHDLIIGIQSSSVQPLPRPRLQPIRLGLSAGRVAMSSFVRAMPDTYMGRELRCRSSEISCRCLSLRLRGSIDRDSRWSDAPG
jgi:hypothetical protein